MSRRGLGWVTDRRTGHKGDDWRDKAACRDEDPELFFPVGTSGPALIQTKLAKAVCRRCPVKNECLKAGLTAGYGIWGGYDEDERRAMREQQTVV